MVFNVVGVEMSVAWERYEVVTLLFLLFVQDISLVLTIISLSSKIGIRGQLWF